MVGLGADMLIGKWVGGCDFGMLRVAVMENLADL